MAKSIISNDRRCYICKSQIILEKHHCVFGTANRKKADQDGLWVYLCHQHHYDVHNKNSEMKKLLQKFAQKHWMEKYGDMDAFIDRYGRSYL